MGILKNLHELGKTLQTEFESVFLPDDVELPSSFKESIKELGGYKYDYKNYLVHIYSNDLNGYIPNQWFIIASFFVDYYLEVQKYKTLLIEVLKSCGLTKSEERKSIMAMYSTELGSKPKDKALDLHKSDTIAKVREKISSILLNADSLDEQDRQYLINFVSDYDWWYGGKTIDRGDFYVSPILALAKVVNASHSYIADICKAFAEAKGVSDVLRDAYKSSIEIENIHSCSLLSSSNRSFQQIFYGAPGTGKSYTINRDTAGEDVIRTTFHPDTDYSTFVGAYKPTTIEEEVMTVIGTKAVPVEYADGTHRKESKIVYEFVQQAFLQAYVAAWKKYAKAQEGEPSKQFLVIEEINRGNCAQIFGDLFQLLDRNAQGFSDYPITADADMKRQLKKAFAGLSLTDSEGINAMYDGRNVCSEVMEGDILLLPSNLYIWATMNTSDQSLFPIDSAFKRRWDWTYRPISDAGKDWKIKAGDNLYDWWTFLQKINDKVGSLTNSEDKKLGYFFCKADRKRIIPTDTFVGKVIFYLWNDVFKDYEFGDTIFDDGKGGKLSFDKFYTSDGQNSKVVEENVALFLKNLGVEPVPTEITSTDDAVNTTSVIKVNGKEIKKINAIPYTAIEEYVKQNPDKTAQEVIDVWEPFKKCSMRRWIVANKEELANMDERYANYSYKIDCADGHSLWVNKDGWMHRPANSFLRDTINEFIHAVNEANLGVTITEEDI